MRCIVMIYVDEISSLVDKNLILILIEKYVKFFYLFFCLKKDKEIKN